MQNNILKSTMFTGLILGIIFSVNFIISASKNMFMGVLSIIITFMIIYYIYREVIKFRNSECDGYITYGKSLLYIILSFFFGALVSSVVKLVYITFIDTNFLDSFKQQQYKIAQGINFFGVNEKDLIDQIEALGTPFGFIIQNIWSLLLMSFVLGLILSFFVKKSKSIFE